MTKPHRLLPPIAAALALCLTLTVAAPATQATAGPRAPVAVAHHDRVDKYFTYTVCLLNDKKLCFGPWDVMGDSADIVTLIGGAIWIFKVIKGIIDKRKVETDETEGEENGGDEGNHLCFAAAAATNDTHDRVYMTSNCFGNNYASWYCVPESRNSCNLYNVASLNQGDSFMLTTISTRDDANVYVKPAHSGDWQKFAWYYWKTEDHRRGAQVTGPAFRRLTRGVLHLAA
jgi:hypothetical protein